MIIHLASNLIILFATFVMIILCHMRFFIINDSQLQGGDFVAEMLKHEPQKIPSIYNIIVITKPLITWNNGSL